MLDGSEGRCLHSYWDFCELRERYTSVNVSDVDVLEFKRGGNISRAEREPFEVNFDFEVMAMAGCDVNCRRRLGEGISDVIVGR